MANITTVNLTSGVPTGPTGAATVSTLDNLIGTTVAPCANIQTIQGNAGGTAVPISGTLAATQSGAWTVSVSGTVTVSGTVSALQSGTWNITNVSGVVSLPTGAATSAKQPALGTGGTPSPDVITVQGISTGTALKVDGSGVTQPVSGTVGISGTVAATQSGAWSVGVTGTVASAQSGNWTTRIVGNTGSILDFNGQNQGSTSAILTGGQFNTIPTTITTGNVSPLQLDSSANLLVNVKTGTITANQGTPPWTVSGDTASGVADANNPIKIGGVARTSNPTAVSNGNRVNASFDKLGKLIAVGAIRDLKGRTKTSITTNTATSVIAAGGVGVFNDVYAIVVTNKSATAVTVDFNDGAAVVMTLAAPAGDTRGFTVAVDSAMVQSGANAAWTATVSAAVTSIEISMLYVSNI